MIRHAADLDRRHLILPRDAAQEWPESVAQLRRDERPAFFDAKDAMVVGANVGHANHSAVPSGLRSIMNSQPNVETLGYCHGVPPGLALSLYPCYVYQHKSEAHRL